MNQTLPILVSILILAGACSNPSPEPEAQPADQSAAKAPAPEPAPAATEAEEAPAEEGPAIQYHFREGRTRAYLPPSSTICQDDETAQPLYEIVALWEFDRDAGEWSSIDVAADVPYRISCNAMLDLINVLGFDLDPGTYAIVAEVDGTPERNVFHVGEMACNDIDLGSPPEGKIPVCVVGPSSAEARFVPDPAKLEIAD